MALTSNRAVLAWIDEMAAMTQPDQLVWIDGSEAQLEELRKQACASGEIEKLNEEKLPGCYLHRTAVNDVARVEDRTFICCRKQEDAGPTNNWMDPQEMYAKLKKLYTGAMKGRTMYVIPYSMGVVGSPFAKYGIELTDSIYVVLNMAIMTRVGQAVADVIGDDFVKGLHAKADIDPANRYIVHFPEDNTIMSVNSGYGGNVLLGKKCFALRIASHLGRQQGWMAEHMLILGVENPQGEVRYLAAAFPSACGKTNLAMLIPPEHYQKAGWKVWCVGDDIAWLRIGEDGRLWAMNPEYGFFGVAPGTNAKSNPNALATTRQGSLCSKRSRMIWICLLRWAGHRSVVRKNTVSAGQRLFSSCTMLRAWRRRLTMAQTLSCSDISAAMDSNGVSSPSRHATLTRCKAANSALCSGRISVGCQSTSFRAEKSGWVAVENTMVV